MKKTFISVMVLLCFLMILTSCFYEDEIVPMQTSQVIPYKTNAARITTQTKEIISTLNALVTPEIILHERIDNIKNAVIFIYKQERLMEVYSGEKLAARMKIALGFTPIDHKTKEGDGKTPEGEYYICYKNENSKFYLSLGLSYPNIDDAKNALGQNIISQSEYNEIEKAISKDLRPPWNTPLGGEIMIHGHGTSSDWTAGCIAVENSDMDYIWENCPIGTRVEILP